MRNVRAIVITLLLTTALMVALVVQAQPREGVPNGKPFQNLQAQIDDLQAQIDALSGGGGSIMVHGSGIEAGTVVKIPAGTRCSFILLRYHLVNYYIVVLFNNFIDKPNLLFIS